MVIKEITYRRLVNLGNYENEAIEATAITSDNEDPVKVREELTEFVNGQLDSLSKEREKAAKEAAEKIEEERKNERLEQERYAEEVKHKISKVKYLIIDAGVRYWDDSCINGCEDTDCEATDDAPKMPFAILTGEEAQILKGSKWRWRPRIDIDEGRIVNWPTDTVADIHYKVCDDFSCAAVDGNDVVLAEYDGYVPPIMYPNEDGWGDYIIMHINAEGIIENWDKELMCELFNKEDWI